MYGLRRRLAQPHRLLLLGLSSVVLVIVLALSALTIQSTAAHSATNGDAVNFDFTVTIAAGTPPSDVQFWLCPDAQADGTGCAQMTAQPNGTYTYQLATTTGKTYQQITIEWSDGQTTNASGPVPTQPAHIACDYPNFTISATGPYSLACNANFAAPTVTPVPSPTPSPTPTDSAPASGSSDNTTLVTGLQVIIGVGIVLFVILLIILIWQRASAARKR